MTSARDTLLAQLHSHQAKALLLLERGDALLAPDACPDPAMISRSRWEMTRVLAAYQAFKHHQLFDPIIRAGPPERVRIAKQMKTECLALGEEFRAHLAHHAGLDIATHWRSYRLASRKLLIRMRAHFARERWVTETMLLPHVAVDHRPDLATLNARPHRDARFTG